MKLPTIILSLLFTSLQATEKPNVLFIMSDDLNTALSGYGHPECQTPNLDTFAKSAVSFTRAYCQFPLCGPSRASIMSGQYPKVNGVTGNGGSLDPGRVTLPKHFRNHRYWTGRVSKIYHMGIPGDIIEGKSGQDHAPSWDMTHNITALETMTPGKIIDYTNPDAPKIFPKERKLWQEAHDHDKPYKMKAQARGQFSVVEVAAKDAGLMADTMAANEAIASLRQRSKSEQPFFLAVGFVRPHFPFVASARSLAPYDARKLKYPAFPADDFDDMPPQAIGARMTFPEQDIKELRRGYFGAVTFMDRQFGRLMAELDRLKLRDDTIVVFVSDHGYLIGEHEMHKKSKLWEEAIHVPLMISGPGLKGGTRCNQFVELIDLYPTLVELAGLPAEPGAQGLSLVSLIKDPASERLSKTSSLIQVSNGFGLRCGKWAYMWYPAKKKNPEAAMLYDMDVDPKQFVNLASNPEYASAQKQLHGQLMSRIEGAGKKVE
ncbi:MAG: iduronate 2-sulfatase [Akkermansiaceae bacterium]|jgi:iduronate 2-sulfatase